jgi:hypothetical protein
MLNEYQILWTAVGSLVGLVVAAALYSLGGRSGKWRRRYVASAVLTGTIIASSLLMTTFTWWSLLCYPLLVLTFSLGYGAESLVVKVLKRSLVAVCGIIATLPLIIPGLHLVLLPLQLILIPVYVWLGVRNPVPAASEEVFICIVLNLGLVMLPFVK